MLHCWWWISWESLGSDFFWGHWSFLCLCAAGCLAWALLKRCILEVEDSKGLGSLELSRTWNPPKATLSNHVFLRGHVSFWFFCWRSIARELLRMVCFWMFELASSSSKTRCIVDHGLMGSSNLSILLPYVLGLTHHLGAFSRAIKTLAGGARGEN